MKLIEVDDSYGEQLKKFFNQNLYPGYVDYSIERVNSFFDQYKLQSDDIKCLALIDPENQIQAFITMIFREAVINGEKQTIGYVTDLTVSNSRKAIMGWAEKFLPMIKEERDKRNCKYVFSAVNQFQSQFFNAFLRPRSTRRKLPRYYLFRKFKRVTVHGKFPFSVKPLKTISITPATMTDLPQLQSYIKTKQLHKPLYYPNRSEDLLGSLKDWRGFELSHFLIAKDRAGKIIGCVCPWNPQQIQKFKVRSLSKRAMTFNQSLNFLSYLGLSRKLMTKDDYLNVIHLTHFYADNPDIHFSLIYNAYKTYPKSMLSFCHFEGDLLTTPPRSLITATIPYDLYCILDPEDDIPDLIRPSFHTPPPEFELAFL